MMGLCGNGVPTPKDFVGLTVHVQGRLIKQRGRLLEQRGKLLEQGGRSIRVAANLANIESWQVHKLQAAYVKGRKRFKVSDLCDEVKLPRKLVLQWMKQFEALEPQVRENILENREAYIKAVDERREALADDEVIEDVTQNWQNYLSPRARVAGMMINKPLSKSTIATMEKIFKTIKYPGDDVLRDLFEIHKVPRQRAIKWFQNRRDRSRR